MTKAHEVVAAYWAACEDRDWAAFGRLLDYNGVYEGPQTRERVRGRDAYIRFNVEGFPGDWHVSIHRIIGEEHHAASWISFTARANRCPGSLPGLHG